MMRISANPDDPGYREDGHKFCVLFNGYEVSRVLTADERRGYIVQFVVDIHGRQIMKDDEWLTERRYGGVAILER